MRIPLYKYINGLVLLLCAMTLVACSGNDGDTDIVTGKAIGFECRTEATKSVKTTANDMQYFRVSAIWDKGGSGYESFMGNQLVERDGANWVYSPVRYWPSYGSVSFFAYSPAISLGMQSFTISNADNEVTFGYKVPSDGQSQEDFLVATALEKTDNPVQLQFGHALASARFLAKTTDTSTSYRINKITLEKLNSTGTLTGRVVAGITTWAWSGISLLTDYEVYQKYAFEVPETYNEVGSLMVLPQVINNGFKIVITYNDTEIITNTLDPGFEFEMGKKYSFYLIIGDTSFSGTQGQIKNSPIIEYSIDSVSIE